MYMVYKIKNVLSNADRDPIAVLGELYTRPASNMLFKIIKLFLQLVDTN